MPVSSSNSVLADPLNRSGTNACPLTPVHGHARMLGIGSEV